MTSVRFLKVLRACLLGLLVATSLAAAQEACECGCGNSGSDCAGYGCVCDEGGGGGGGQWWWCDFGDWCQEDGCPHEEFGDVCAYCYTYECNNPGPDGCVCLTTFCGHCSQAPSDPPLRHRGHLPNQQS